MPSVSESPAHVSVEYRSSARRRHRRPHRRKTTSFLDADIAPSSTPHSPQRRSTSSVSPAHRRSSSNHFTPTHNVMPLALNAQRKRKERLITKLIRKHRHLLIHSDAYEDDELKTSTSDLVRAFRQLAIADGGLLNGRHRQVIWRLLACDIRQFAIDEHRVNVPTSLVGSRSSGLDADHSDTCSVTDSMCSTSLETPCTSSATFLDDIDTLKQHPEWNQVQMDVQRTLARFPPDIDDERRNELQEMLTPLVVSVLMEDEHYRYYQGFHDVCLTLLLVIDDPQYAQEACSCLAQHGIFSRFLREPLELAAPMLVHLLYIILWQTDPELEAFLRRAELGHMFALPWLLTWFAHSIDNCDTVIRLYDLFLASHCLMPVYFAAALILYRGSEIQECDCEMTAIHTLLTRSMPKHFPLEALIADAQDLFMQYPPSLLRGELLQKYDSQLQVLRGAPIILRAPTGRSLGDFIRRQLDVTGVMLGANKMHLLTVDVCAENAKDFERNVSRTMLQTNRVGERLSTASAVVCAVTATAAAWYIYSKFGTTQMSWMQLF